MIVLDTHVFLWYALDAPELNKALKAEIEKNPSSVQVPSICIWEAMLLAEKGRIQIEGDHPGAVLRGFLEAAGFQEASLTSEIAVLSRTLAFEHEDPADRFIAATSYALGAQLATADERLRALDWVKLAY